jgi:hypothetical protein
MAMETKYRSTSTPVTGKSVSPTGSTLNYDVKVEVSKQSTWSQSTLFPYIRRKLKTRTTPSYWLDFMSNQDLGGPFRTERGSIVSSLDSVSRQGYFSGPWKWDHSGPVLLAGFSTPFTLASSQEVVDEQALMFGLGGTAIARCRPGKPQVDLSVALGELRFGGLPTLIGSTLKRSETLRQVMRDSGSEYLNIQFGWAPLVRDLQNVALAVLSTRTLLQEHEKQLNKLLRRSYRFDTQRKTVEGLSKANSNYELYPTRSMTYCGTRVQLGLQAPSEITRTVTNSHFAGGFRFYYPDLSNALDALTKIEDEANTLLGTRLDPEVLWNLMPWSWMIDWFITFGDVIGNISAIAADHLVMQYGYIMHEVSVEKEIYFPLGLYSRNSGGGMTSSFDYKPWSVTLAYHSKTRVGASPFGFGLSPEQFSADQWAILGALGISRGLK